MTGSRENIEKQRTLQRMLDRNGEIDEELTNKLLGNPLFTKEALDATGTFRPQLEPTLVPHSPRLQ